jgi:hypothetical protein
VFQATPDCVVAVAHLGRRRLCRSRCKLQPPPPRRAQCHRSLQYCRVSKTLGVSSWGRGMRLPPSIALAVPCLALICCVGGRSLCLAWNTRPPDFRESLFSGCASCSCCISSISKRLVCVSAFFPLAAPCPPTPFGPMPVHTRETGPYPLCRSLCTPATVRR